MSAAALDDLRAAMGRAAAALGGTPKAPPTLERPRQADHGDYATNAALLLAGGMRAKPRDVADRLADAVRTELDGDLARVEVAGPGFLNLVLADAWYLRALAAVLDAGAAYGAGTPARVRSVNVEFVSANPTGPLHVGGARGAAYGDALARLLVLAGHRVFREYYVNDFGSQITKLAESVRARARGEDVPPDGYQGAYVADLAAGIPGAAGLELEELGPQAVALVLDGVRASLERFGVVFDRWSSERDLYAERDGGPSPIDHVLALLAEQGRTYHHDGALWLRTTAFGDDKDRVLERASGQRTYFAPDIAYHQDKLERGFDLLIDVWGADHHGYRGRMLAAFEALGGRREDLELLIMQLVSLTDAGEAVRMSKRAGEFVTIDDLVDDVGVDAARWYLLQRSHDTTMELDVAQARQQSAENPVYYVQYAHARIAGILRRSDAVPAPTLPDGAALHPSERGLVKALLQWPDEVREAADRRAPHRVATYALDLAQTFTAFYRDCPVVGAPEEALRVALCVATQRTIAAALAVLGVSAPDEMRRDDAASA